MNLKFRIQNALSYSESLHQAIGGKVLIDDSIRNQISLRLFAIAHSHYDAILLLIQNEHYTSSAALLRSLTESYIRGLWLWKCADDVINNKIVSGQESFKKIGVLFDEISKNSTVDRDFIPMDDNVKNYIKIMNDLTHTGILHINKWNRSDVVESNFQQTEIEELLQSTEAIGSRAILAISFFAFDHSVNDNVIKLINDHVNLRFNS